MADPVRKSIAKPAAVPAEPPAQTRTRIVKRYVALCAVDNLFENGCSFTGRSKTEVHGTSAAAEVEAGRHVRSAHADLLTREVKAKRTVQVRRTVVSDELVPEEE